MNAPYTKKLPVIIDLQPEPESLVRLPQWMMYLFAIFYIIALIGTGLVLRESTKFFNLYQEMENARKLAAQTTAQINVDQKMLSDYRQIQADYDTYKHKQKNLARPGVLLDWIPSLLARDQKAWSITMQQIGENVEIRLTLEKPIAESITQPTKGPSGYQLVSSDEQTPKFNELPVNQRPSPNNEYTALVVNLRKLPVQ